MKNWYRKIGVANFSWRFFLTALLTTLLGGPAYADDVDIYIRQADSISEETRPNILFMLDNSGSMNQRLRDPKTGTPLSQKRIDVLQEALLQMLSEVYNVNVGLARFASLMGGKMPSNAPILFPVFYIDADLREVPGEANNSIVTVSSRIANSGDDAEENLGSSKVRLARPQLQMVKLKTSDDFKGVKIEQPIEDKGKDAAGEWLGNTRFTDPALGNKDKGVVKTAQSTLVLGSDTLPDARNRGDSLVALRFPGLTIPVGAKIEKAEVEFTSDQSYAYEKETDAVKLVMYAANNDGSVDDISGQEFPSSATMPSGYLSNKDNFPSTATTIQWTIDTPIEEGQTFVTPDISAIIQEVIRREAKANQNGWSEGNSIVMMFKSAPDSPPNGRTFVSKKDLYAPPILRLSWTITEAKTEVISGKGPWNARDKAYKVATNDQDVDYSSSAFSCGGDMILGYCPKMVIPDLSELQKIVDEAKAAYEEMKNVTLPQKKIDAKTATDEAKTAKTALKTTENNYKKALDAIPPAETNYQLAKDAYEAKVAELLASQTSLKQEIEAALLGMNTAEANLQKAQAAYDIVDPNYTAALAAKTEADATKDAAELAKDAALAAKTAACPPSASKKEPACVEATTVHDNAKATSTTANDAYKSANDAYSVANSAKGALSTAQTAYNTAKKTYDSAVAKLQKIVQSTTLDALKTKMLAKEQILNDEKALADTALIERDKAKIAYDGKQQIADDINALLAGANNTLTALKVAWDKAKADLLKGKVKQVKGVKTTVGLRFQQLPLPKGATVKEAYITFTHQGSVANLKTASQLPLNLMIYGEKIANADDFKVKTISQRTATDTSVEWSAVAPATPNEKFTTPLKTQTVPDLSGILQEIINQDDWQSKNSIVFLFENSNEANFDKAFAPEIGGFRPFIGIKDKTPDEANLIQAADLTSFYNLPKLTVKYSAGVGDEGGTADSNEQIVGFRFEGVDIPQGAKITNATIDFKSDSTETTSSKLKIKIENADEAAPFEDAPKNISSRNLTGQVDWEVQPWEKGITYTTPDLTSLVQTVVKRSGWCGGRGGIAFVVAAGSADDTTRLVKSFDNAPFFAPVLNIEYDLDSVPDGACIQQSYAGQITFETDDAEEITSGSEAGDIYLSSDSLEMGAVSDQSRLVGFRFREVPVSKTAKVLDARLILTARTLREDKGAATTKLNIQGEKAGDSAPFGSGSGNLSTRKKTTTKLPWDGESGLTSWQKNFTYTSPDLTPVIQEIISQKDWATYNNMALLISGTPGRRDANAFKAGPTTAAVLRIRVEGYLGEGEKGNLMTVRRQLKKITNTIQIPASITPLVDAFYESAQYFRGGVAVDYGKTRHGLADYLVSHPGTYTGGDLSRPVSCSAAKPFDKVCAPEEIKGSPKYVSPVKSPCQSNHIVLLTDGLANRNESADKIKSLMGSFQSSCDKTFPDPDSVSEDPTQKATTLGISSAELCGVDLSRFLHQTDNNKVLKDEQFITTHTIGFQLGKGWREKYVDPLSGRPVREEDKVYYYIDNGEVVPDSVTVQSVGYEPDEKLSKQNAEAVKYLRQIAKEGGGDFYPADSVDQLLAAFKSIVAQAVTTSTLFAAPGVSVNRFNSLFHDDEIYYSLFKPDRLPRWHGNVKKFRLCQGTEGTTCKPGELLDAEGKAAVVDQYLSSTAKSFWSKEVDGGQVTVGGSGEQVPAPGTRKIFTYLGEAAPGVNHNVVLDDPNYIISTETPDLSKALFGDDPADDFEKVVNWILGQDVMDEDQDGNFKENRWPVADPLHSSPGVVVYGGTEAETIAKIFVGTNDGLLRMIDATTGEEDWAFLPKELLPKQKDLMENQPGERIYGVDSTPTFWMKDTGGNVQIEPENGDFVKLYVGMRRGGSNLYALDVTGEADAPGASPKLMWVIKGGVSPFEKLGQTWSRALPVHVSLNGEDKVVLLFGGGYHTSQDEGFGPTDSLPAGGGNAIFMVDAETGQRLWWASSSGADLNLQEMRYPIPADLLLKDTNTDKMIDRIYVGDIGGQVWRIDINGLASGQSAMGMLFATVSDTTNTERRRFFYAPELIRISDSKYSSVVDYDLLAIVSGTRTEPLDRLVRNQFYAFRDEQQGPLTNTLDLTPITTKQMVDLTDNVIQEGDENARVQVVVELKGKKGWYVNLQEEPGDDKSWIGEKGTSEPLIKDDKVYFTTYVPPAQSTSVCEFSEGFSRFYALDILTAGAVYNFDETTKEGQDGLTASDRFIAIPGVAPPPKSYSPGGPVETVGSGPNTNLTPPEERKTERFFWMQK